MSAAIKPGACGAISKRVTRVELRESLESALRHLDVSRLPPEASREQVGEWAKQRDGSSEFALYVVVKPGRSLPALGVRALRVRLYQVENPPEVTGVLSADRCVPLRGYIYEENGSTVLLTYDQPSSALAAKELGKTGRTLKEKLASVPTQAPTSS